MGFLNIGKIQSAHRERSQPEKRQRFGLLEKKKDYVKRAKVYNQKQRVLHNLRRKAAFKNPDEFYFRMINSTTRGGIHQDTKAGVGSAVNKAETHSRSVLKLYNSQDLNYLRNMHQKESAKLEKLESELHYIQSSPKNHKIVFVGEEFDESKVTLLEPMPLSEESNPKYDELKTRRERLARMDQLIKKIQLQQNLMEKSTCIKVKEFKDQFGDPDPTRPSEFKWKQERKS